MTLGPFLDLILIKLCVPMLIPLRAQVGLRHKFYKILDNLEKYEIFGMRKSIKLFYPS